LHTSRFQGFQKSLSDRFIDLQAADVEAVDTAPLTMSLPAQ